MRLSEAMLLGSTTCKMVPGDWNSCALGCAGNAVGIPQSDESGDGDRRRWMAMYAQWPWLLSSGRMSDIFMRFDFGVCEGKTTLEQLVDYVRSIEPECGECCRFECICPKTAAVAEEKELVAAQ